MDVFGVFEKIKELQSDYVSLWVDICNIESPSNHKDGVDAVGRYLTDFAKAKGWETECFSQEISGDCICITANKNGKKPPVAFSGHMDTVHPLGLFGTPPVKIKDGIIYGPGVSDCKGGIVASLLAMDALLQCGFTDRPLLLLLQSDEEISSMPNNKQTVRYMAEKAKDCVAFLNAEPFAPGKITVARKGILRYEFTVHGRSVHSSVCHKGASAIAEAAHKILALEQWKDPDGITCNCGVISGGTVGNTVPDTCTFIADIRYATPEQRETVEASVQKIASESSVEGTFCDLSLKSYRVPMERNEVNDALFARVSEIFREAKLPEVIPWQSKGGSDASDLTAYGIPCLDSLGVPGAREHSHEEHAPLDGLVTSARMLAAIAYLI